MKQLSKIASSEDITCNIRLLSTMKWNWGRSNGQSAYNLNTMALNRHALFRYTAHKLQHVHGTMLMEDGWEPKEIMERLGHSSITVTMNIYAHIRRGSLKEKVDRLDRLFRTN